MDAERVVRGVDAKGFDALPRAPLGSAKRPNEGIIASAHGMKRRPLSELATSLLPFARQIEETFFHGLFREALERRERHDPVARVRARKLVARAKRLDMEHTRINEQNIEREPCAVGHVTEHGPGAL